MGQLARTQRVSRQFPVPDEQGIDEEGSGKRSPTGTGNCDDGQGNAPDGTGNCDDEQGHAPPRVIRARRSGSRPRPWSTGARSAASPCTPSDPAPCRRGRPPPLARTSACTRREQIAQWLRQDRRLTAKRIRRLLLPLAGGQLGSRGGVAAGRTAAPSPAVRPGSAGVGRGRGAGRGSWWPTTSGSSDCWPGRCRSPGPSSVGQCGCAAAATSGRRWWCMSNPCPRCGRIMGPNASPHWCCWSICGARAASIRPWWRRPWGGE